MNNKVTDGWPLQWPLGYARTQHPKRAAFKANQVGRNIKDILTEIKRLGGTDPIISTNIPLRSDGLPYADWQRRSITDYGVAVYFTYDGSQTVLAYDKWDRIEDNMRAISLAIEAMRGMDRWGVSDLLKRAFMGFKALPAGDGVTSNEVIQTPKRDWWDVLHVHKGSSDDMIQIAYKHLSKKYHPDGGGEFADIEKFKELTEAFSEIKAERGFK